MKKFKLFILALFIILSLTACNKQKKETEKVLMKSAQAEVAEETQNLQAADIDIDKNALPEEFDIASGHKTKTENWFSEQLSSDGKYTAYESGEYYDIYERYCIPVEGERKDLNLIMLKEESPIYNPNDLGANNKSVCKPGCEFVPIARSAEPVSFNNQTSYWLKVTENEWIPGSAVYIQPGVFAKLPAESLEVGMAYETIKDGIWFIVKTDDGSSLRLRDSSNIKTGIISSIPQGTWIYADAQTSKTETIDGIDARWYKIAYPEKGYVFGGYLEKQEGVCSLKFASLDVSYYRHDDSNDYTFKVYSAPTTKSQYLGEYEIKPSEYGYLALIESNQLETVDGVKGVWINIEEPVKGFIFGHNFVYK